MDDTQRTHELLEIQKIIFCRMWKMSSYGIFSVFMRPDGSDMGVDDIVCVAAKFRSKNPHSYRGEDARVEVAERLHALGFHADMKADEAAILLGQAT